MTVKVKGLPLSKYTQEEARCIGKKLSSKLLKGKTIDPLTRQFLVRVEIDIRNPLNPGYFIGEQIFIQFKYRCNGMLCECCGKVDHMKCEKVPEEIPIHTQNINIPKYGRWMYDLKYKRADVNFVIVFPEKLVDVWTELEETVHYPQFFIKLEVSYVCASEPEWRKKKLFCPSIEDVIEHGFRFPISYLTTTLQPSDDPYKVLAREMDENVSLVGLIFEDKVEIVRKLVDYTMKSKEIWSRRKLVQVKICVTKTTKIVPYVDFKQCFKKKKDKEYHRELDRGIKRMIQRRANNNEDIVSLTLWRKCIGDLVGEQQLMPFNLEKRCNRGQERGG